MKLIRSALVAAVAALGLAGAAQAGGNVFFSVGAQVAPGLGIGVTNVAPVVIAPAPVYYAPASYYAPAPVVYEEPVYWRPRPVYYYPTSRVVVVRHHGKHWHH